MAEKLVAENSKMEGTGVGVSQWGGENMAEIETVQADTRETWASDRRKAAMAARLLACCLGIEAEPAFDITGEASSKYQRSRPYGMGDCVFKDTWDVSSDEELGRFQILLVDEHGNILAESAQTYLLGHTMGLLERLPVRLSPNAPQWLKDALGEPSPREGRATGDMRRDAPGCLRPVTTQPASTA
jgi:hypothetical protein